MKKLSKTPSPLSAYTPPSSSVPIRAIRGKNPIDISKFCGVRIPPKAMRAAAPAPAAGSDPGMFCWDDYCLPTYNQDGSSCVGQSWANWLELMVRRYIDHRAIPARFQISGEAIYKRACDLFFHGDYSGGLYLDQGFHAAKELGILPSDATLQVVRNDWISMGIALDATPVVTGHMIDAGWSNPDPDNGCLDHAPKNPNQIGGHATLRIGRLYYTNTRFYVHQNSWGADWGWHGLFLIDEIKDQKTIMSMPCCTAKFNLQSFTHFHGWEKLLVKKS